MTLDESDEPLVRGTLAGDATAFESLVRRYRRAALARALSIVGNSFAAEDVAQDAFVQAYEQLATLREHARFGAWLLMIVHRRSLNALRAEKRRRAVPLTDAIPDRTARATDGSADPRASRASILVAMRALTEVQCTVVLLADLEGWPHERIATTVGCSIAMSRRHLSDARKRLRELLAQEVRR
ncbi:MAG TPA: RNA polymerase sigma factor [Gemmatimonadaceae bacterium]|nr:RNA polymerase sigma factor [Gemmatimonadaceae bacterium]